MKERKEKGEQVREWGRKERAEEGSEGSEQAGKKVTQ